MSQYAPESQEEFDHYQGHEEPHEEPEIPEDAQRTGDKWLVKTVQNVIEYSLNEFDQRYIEGLYDFHSIDGHAVNNTADVKQFLVNTISSILSILKATVKHLPNGFPIPEEVLTLVTTKHPILRNAHVARAGYNIAVDEFQELLQSAKEQIR